MQSTSSLSEMQAVILAGGLGERLGDLAQGQPKSMVDINGAPFLKYQLALLRERGITDVVLCVGHLANAVRGYFRDGSDFGVRIKYSVEPGCLLGTAGAVKQAESLLEPVFFLTYGDAYLRMDYAAALRELCRRGTLGLMVLFHNENRYGRSNVVVEDGLVGTYDKEHEAPGMDYINFGVSVLRREALALVPPGVPYSQEDWYEALIRERELAAFETKERFYEVGSPEGLAEFRSLVARGGSRDR